MIQMNKTHFNAKIEVALAGNFLGVTIYFFASINFTFLFFYNNSL